MTLSAIIINEWFGGILLTCFISLIVWIFLRSVNSQEKLNDTVNSLQRTLEGLKSMIDGQVEERSVIKAACTERHTGVNERINGHDVSIKDHDKRITVVETTLKVRK